MKVFAKYLPIKGEIRKNDIVTDLVAKGKVASVKGDIIEMKENTITYKVNKSNFVRVKLFACTYENIKEGDIVVVATQDKTFIKIVKSSNQDGYYLADHKTGERQFYESRYVFKVLGEIAEGISWLKDEQEIDIVQTKNNIRVKCPHCESLF